MTPDQDHPSAGALSAEVACSAAQEEHMDDNYAICPYCRFKNHVESEDYDSNEREEHCSRCDAVFIQFEEFTVTHCTRPCPPNSSISRESP